MKNARYLRSLCDEYGCQSDCIINDNAEVIHKMVRQPGTFVIFQNFLSGDYHNVSEISTFLLLWEKDALVADCYDYDSGSEYVSFLQLIDEAYWPEVSKWK